MLHRASNAPSRVTATARIAKLVSSLVVPQVTRYPLQQRLCTVRTEHWT